MEISIKSKAFKHKVMNTLQYAVLNAGYQIGDWSCKFSLKNDSPLAMETSLEHWVDIKYDKWIPQKRPKEDLFFQNWKYSVLLMYRWFWWRDEEADFLFCLCVVSSSWMVVNKWWFDIMF